MSLRLKLLEVAERQALNPRCPPAHLQVIRLQMQRLRQELAGNPMVKPDYRNADPATAYPRALAAMRNPAFLKTPKYQEQQAGALRQGAHPHIVEFAEKLVKRGAQMGIPLFPLCIVRSYEDQMSAYVRGASKDSPADGLWPHMAFAVDIIHGKLAYMEKPIIYHAWEIIGHLGKEVANSMDIEIEWGGDWPWRDAAHFELKGWKDIAVSGDKWWSPNGPVGTVER